MSGLQEHIERDMRAHDESRTVDVVAAVCAPTVRANDAVATRAITRQARRAEDSHVTLGTLDDHFAALRYVATEIVGGEYDSAVQIAHAILDTVDDLERLL